MAKIRALIVDDEPLARAGIRDLLSCDPDVCITGECRDGIDAIEKLQEKKTDLLFLDVEMPEVNGFEVLEAISAPPIVIFVTAFDRYAVKAFTFHAFDYLLKPLDPDRFSDALKRAKEAFRRDRTRSEKLRDLLLTMRKHQRRPERIVVRASGRILFLETTEIDWVGAAGDYVSIHSRGKKFLLRETMQSLEQRLNPEAFIRIHRSTIVNARRIKELRPLMHGEYVLLLEDGTNLIVSRSYRERISLLIVKT